MADKSFGVKELNLLNASGTPTVTSPNNLNLNANTVAISTSCTIGSNLTVSGDIDVDGHTELDNVNIAGVVTATTFSGSGASLTNLPATDPTNSDIQVVYTVTANGSSAYRFAGNGVVSTADNTDLHLIRGQKYRFVNNSGGSHPFQIRVSSGGSAYSTGVTNNGAASGNIHFAPTYDSPAQLVYQCTSHGGMVGNIYIQGAGGGRGILTQNTTLSGNSVSYDGIPSWATKITFVFHRLSLDSNSGGVGSQPGVEVRLRQSGSDITSTYTSIAHGFGDNDSNPADFSGTMYVNTDSFGMNFTHAAHWYSGKMEIEKVGSTNYVSRFSMLRNTASSGNLQQQRMGNGELTLSSGTADGISIFCSNSSHNFDSTPYTNRISVYYE